MLYVWAYEGGKDLLEQQMQRVPHRQNNIVQHDLVLVHAADDVHHDVALALVQHDAVVIQDDVPRLLGRLLEQALLEGLLRFGVRVRRAGGV